MRLFCFSDTHQRALPECIPAPDAWLFGGDLYDKPDRGGLTVEDVEFRNAVAAWRDAHPQPVYAVRGNHDLHDRAGFFRSAIDLTEGGVRSIGNDLFVAGLGWTGEQYFDLPMETHLVERCHRIEDDWARVGGSGRLILLTHYPPHDQAALPYMGSREGFFFDCISDLIDEIKPLVVITGHSHVQFGRVVSIRGVTTVLPGRTGRLLAISDDRKRFELEGVRSGEVAG